MFLPFPAQQTDSPKPIRSWLELQETNTGCSRLYLLLKPQKRCHHTCKVALAPKDRVFPLRGVLTPPYDVSFFFADCGPPHCRRRQLFKSEPTTSRISTTAEKPLTAAHMRGVSPSWSRAFLFAPFSISNDVPSSFRVKQQQRGERWLRWYSITGAVGVDTRRNLRWPSPAVVHSSSRGVSPWSSYAFLSAPFSSSEDTYPDRSSSGSTAKNCTAGGHRGR